MSMLSVFIFFLLAFAMTYFMRAYALKKNIIDNPNERSSHSVPTPRGGGVAVVCSYLLALAVLIYNQQLTLHIGLTLMAAGFVIALLGFLDDHGHINSMLRLAVHFLVAIGVVISLVALAKLQLLMVCNLAFSPILLRYYFWCGCSIYTTLWMALTALPVSKPLPLS